MSNTLRYIAYIIFILLVFFTIGALSISYSITVYLMSGILVAWFLITLAPRIIEITKHTLSLMPKWLYVLVFVLLISIIASFGILLLMAKPIGSELAGYAEGTSCSKTGDATTEITVTEYHASVVPVDFSQGIFKISEEVKYKIENVICESNGSTTKTIMEEGKDVSIPERTVYSSKRGLIVQELHIIPLDGSPLKYDCCSNKGDVELIDFPRNSFYEARNIQNIATSHYLDTEIVQWNQYLGRDDIVFAYIANPFRFFRNLLSPLIGVSYQNNWLIGLASLLASLIITPITKSLFEDFIKNKFKALIEKKETSQGKTEKSHLTLSSKAKKEAGVKKPK